MSGSKKVLFQLTGSIAAYKACEVVSRLVKTGYEVQVVASANALKFVGEATLEGLTGRPVQSEVFARGNMMDHIHLVRWADTIVLCPATAKTLNRLATGTGDDLISTLYLAHDFQKPYLVAPAMNHFMYHHPSTQASIKKLQDLGLIFIDPENGDLACGESGDGRLANPEKIYRQIEKYFTPKKNKKVLITFGGTEEPIDGVRSISNFSTGQTGAFLADELERQGYEVTALQAWKAAKPQLCTDNHYFKSFNDLENNLKKLLGENSFDAVIHLAAVSDFSVETIISGEKSTTVTEQGKLSSEAPISIQLKRNKKLIHELKSYSSQPEKLKVIGFKLTHSFDEERKKEAVKKLFKGTAVDFVVHNDLAEIDAQKHPHRIYHRNSPVALGNNKEEMAALLGQIIHQGEISL